MANIKSAFICYGSVQHLRNGLCAAVNTSSVHGGTMWLRRGLCKISGIVYIWQRTHTHARHVPPDVPRPNVCKLFPDIVYSHGCWRQQSTCTGANVAQNDSPLKILQSCSVFYANGGRHWVEDRPQSGQTVTVKLCVAVTGLDTAQKAAIAVGERR